MKARHLALVAALGAFVGCKGSEPAPEVVTPPAPTAAPSDTPQPVLPPPPAAATASPAPSDSQGLASTTRPALLNPAALGAKAPPVFKARFNTTKGTFVIEVHRDWAPFGADRFYNLVKAGFFDDTRFFRAIEGFMVQFGLSGDPAVNAKWQEAAISDDTGKQSNKRGFVTFAMRGPNTRTTQVFVNYGDNTNLDAMSFSPFGEVTQGMDVVDSLYKGYGEGAPRGEGPDQGRIQSQGNRYLDAQFPKLDSIKTATIVP